MDDLDIDDDFGRDTGPYPRQELRLAKRSFLISWTKAIYRSAVVKHIHEAHRLFPPKIRVKNCIEYPFQDEYVQNIMPHGRGDLSKPQHIRGPIISGKRKRYSPIDLYCNFLRTNIEPPIKKHITINSVQSSSGDKLYVCDNCTYETAKQDEAVQHLKSSSHGSCSEYSFTEFHEEEDGRSAVITDPRAVVLNLKASHGWKKNDVTVVCPVCDLILPDKLLCGYHHQIHHPGHRAQCSFGLVLAVRDLELHRDLFCSQCNNRFRSQATFIDHWYKPNSSCVSPFLLSPPRDGVRQLPPDHVIEMRCLTCQVHIDRITPRFNGERYILPKKRKRKRGTSEDSFDQMLKWVDGLSRICVNHVYLHMERSRNNLASCRLRIRFVQVDKSQVYAIPPFSNHSDAILLEWCLTECKRLCDHLERFRTGRKALYRQTKVALSELRETTHMHSHFSKVNSTSAASSSTSNVSPPLFRTT